MIQNLKVNKNANQTPNPYPFIKIFINHNLSKPLFLIFISSVLYFIKKINIENRVNAAVIIIKGNIIEVCIDDFDKRFIRQVDAVCSTSQLNI